MVLRILGVPRLPRLSVGVFRAPCTPPLCCLGPCTRLGGQQSFTRTPAGTPPGMARLRRVWGTGGQGRDPREGPWCGMGLLEISAGPSSPHPHLHPHFHPHLLILIIISSSSSSWRHFHVGMGYKEREKQTQSKELFVTSSLSADPKQRGF